MIYINNIILPINVERHSIVFMTLLNAKRLDGNKELCSNHQSSHVLSVYSNVLHKADEREYRSEWIIRTRFWDGNNFAWIPGKWNMICSQNIIQNIKSRKVSTLGRRCFKISGEILSRPVKMNDEKIWRT